MVYLKEPKVILCDSPYAALILIQNLPKNKRGKLFKTLLKGDFGSQLVSQVQSQLSSLVKTCFRTTLFDLINYQIKWQLDDRIISQLYVQMNEQRKTNLHPYLEGAIIPEAWSCAGSYIDYSISVLNCEFKQDEWNILLSVVENCGWIFPFEKICFVCDRPKKLSFDSQQRLHAEGEPAIEFADGFRVYAYHGIRLPEKYALFQPHEWPTEWYSSEPSPEIRRFIIERLPSSYWQSEWILKEKNAELRRVLIQGIGYERICLELEAEVLDKWQDYTLLRINQFIDDARKAMYLLKMTCPSTGYIHVLRVPPDMQSAREAIRWVNWGIEPEEFSVQT